MWCLIGHSSGVDKEILEVYDFLVWIYYDLNVGYATQLLEEFSTAITHTNLANGVSYARYWSLISSKFIKKEGILVHSKDEKADFSTLATPQLLVDDPVIFPIVARITDAMLSHVDLKNPLLVKYLETFDTNVSVCVLLPNRGSSKVVKVAKKKKKKQTAKPQHD